MAKVFLKPRRARPFWYGHPWVFSGAVDRVRGQVRDGDVVELHDFEGNLIGRGFYNSRSQIRVRSFLAAGEGEFAPEVLIRRLDRAVDLRLKTLGLPGRTNAFRLVHGEGDGIPGLVADLLGDELVVQVSCLGISPWVKTLVDHVRSRVPLRAAIERRSQLAEEEGLSRPEGVLFGEPASGPLEVGEDGVAYFCDPRDGQKTGFYSDQRDNRIALAPLASGLRVLDAFCYVGGFGLRMAKAGAASVHFLDSSGSALEFARLGAVRNGVEDRTTFERGNVLRQLDHYAREGRRFDLVVLDPPKFVHKRAALERGLRLYTEVNEKALAVLEDGGILATCSCSQHVADDLFDGMAGEAAYRAGVRLQEIYRGGQSADHPVMVPLAESRYLKCRAYRVDRIRP